MSDLQLQADQDVSKDAYNRTTGANDEKEKDEGDQEAAGLEAEDGEYVNLELAFAYRSSQSVRKAKDREKNAHLYMAFYLPGGVKFRKFTEISQLLAPFPDAINFRSRWLAGLPDLHGVSDRSCLLHHCPMKYLEKT